MSGTAPEALTARLEAYAGLTALVGTRIYPLTLPQNATLPALTYQRIPGERVRSVSGATGMMRARFEVHVWDESVSGAQAVGIQVQDALEGWSGVASTVTVKLIRIDDGRDTYEPDPATVHITYQVWFDYEEP
jgi:hypothetical protein